MLSLFERLVDPFPDAPPATPPHGFFAFLWAATGGLRPWLVALTILSALIGVFEAYLFAMLGDIVDWLAKIEPAKLWAQERERLLTLAGVLAGSVGRAKPVAGHYPKVAAAAASVGPP